MGGSITMRDFVIAKPDAEFVFEPNDLEASTELSVVEGCIQHARMWETMAGLCRGHPDDTWRRVAVLTQVSAPAAVRFHVASPLANLLPRRWCWMLHSKLESPSKPCV